MYSYWKQLPWKNIDRYILILQKRIYQASLECNLRVLKYNQYRLINSFELKLKAIKSLYELINIYYLQHNNDQYIKKDIFDDEITSILYYNGSSKSNWALDKIEQYIAFMSIQPEWKAKIEPFILRKQCKLRDSVKLSTLVNKLNGFTGQVDTLSIACFLQYIDIDYLLSKMKLSLETHIKLKNWLKAQSIIQFSSFGDLFEYQWKHIYYTFSTYLFYILYNGIEWLNLTRQHVSINEYQKLTINKVFLEEFNKHIIVYKVQQDFAPGEFIHFFIAIGLELKLLKSRVKYSNYIIEYKKKLFNLLIKSIKRLLYKKDSLGRLRANTHLNLSKSMYKVKKYFINFYQNYAQHLSTNDLVNISNNIESLFISWLKKKYQNYRSTLLR